jgi:hypothetical protein
MVMVDTEKELLAQLWVELASPYCHLAMTQQSDGIEFVDLRLVATSDLWFCDLNYADFALQIDAFCDLFVNREA